MCTCMRDYIWWVSNLCLLLSLTTGMWSVSATVIGTVCECVVYDTQSYGGKEKVWSSSYKRVNFVIVINGKCAECSLCLRLLEIS